MMSKQKTKPKKKSLINSYGNMHNDVTRSQDLNFARNKIFMTHNRVAFDPDIFIYTH